jgi:hypothetical protein
VRLFTYKSKKYGGYFDVRLTWFWFPMKYWKIQRYGLLDGGSKIYDLGPLSLEFLITYDHNEDDE